MNCCKHNVSEILENLWIGNYKNSFDRNFIGRFNIKKIVNLTNDVPNIFRTVQYLQIPIKNNEICTKNLNKMYDKITEFIYDGIKNKCGVLVFCRSGDVRSASIGVAFLIRYLRIDFFDAIRYINHIRKCDIFGNEGEDIKTCILRTLFLYHLHRAKVGDSSGCLNDNFMNNFMNEPCNRCDQHNECNCEICNLNEIKFRII